MAQGCRVRHQRNGPCPFDCRGQLSLVLGAVAGYASRDNLAPLCGKEPERSWILIVDGEAAVGAEPAELSPVKYSSPTLLEPYHLRVPPVRLMMHPLLLLFQVSWIPACYLPRQPLFPLVETLLGPVPALISVL